MKKLELSEKDFKFFVNIMKIITKARHSKLHQSLVATWIVLFQHKLFAEKLHKTEFHRRTASKQKTFRVALKYKKIVFFSNKSYFTL